MGDAAHKIGIFRAKSDIFEKSERIAAKDLKLFMLHGTIGTDSLLILRNEDNFKKEKKLE